MANNPRYDNFATLSWPWWRSIAVIQWSDRERERELVRYRPVPAVPSFPSGIAIISSTSVLLSRRRTPGIVALSQGHVDDPFLTVPVWRLLHPNPHAETNLEAKSASIIISAKSSIGRTWSHCAACVYCLSCCWQRKNVR